MQVVQHELRVKSIQMDPKVNRFLRLIDRIYDQDCEICTFCQTFSKSEILETIRKNNPNFRKYIWGDESDSMLLTGSMAEGCLLPRTFATGEFEVDFMTTEYIKETEIIEDIPGNPGYVYVISKPKGPSDTEVYVSPHKCRIRVTPDDIVSRYKYFLTGFCETLLPDEPSFLSIDGSAKATNASKQLDVGITLWDDKLNLSIDIVPSKIIINWPHIASDWITRPRKWPSLDDVLRIAGMGCHIVAKSSPGGNTDREWRYSFSLSELELVKLQSRNQRRTYFIIKLLLYLCIKPLCNSENELSDSETGSGADNEATKTSTVSNDSKYMDHWSADESDEDRIPNEELFNNEGGKDKSSDDGVNNIEQYNGVVDESYSDITTNSELGDGGNVFHINQGAKDPDCDTIQKPIERSMTEHTNSDHNAKRGLNDCTKNTNYQFMDSIVDTKKNENTGSVNCGHVNNNGYIDPASDYSDVMTSNEQSDKYNQTMDKLSDGYEEAISVSVKNMETTISNPVINMSKTKPNDHQIQFSYKQIDNILTQMFDKTDFDVETTFESTIKTMDTDLALNNIPKPTYSSYESSGVDDYVKTFQTDKLNVLCDFSEKRSKSLNDIAAYGMDDDMFNGLKTNTEMSVSVGMGFKGFVTDENTKIPKEMQKGIAYENSKNSIHSYGMKTVWMWFCEQNPPEDGIWEDDNIERVVKELLESYHEFIESGYIPNYFIPEMNIIQGMSVELQQKAKSTVQYLLDNVWVGLKSIADMLEVFEEAINDSDDSDLETALTIFNYVMNSFPYPIGDPDVDD